MEREQAKVLNYKIDLFSFKDAIEYTKYLLDTDYSAQVVTINPEMIEYALKNDEFSTIINNAELVIPDGIGIKIALAINGKKVERIPGIEYAKRMIEICAEKNIPIAMIGAKKHILEKAVENLKNEYKNINIVYKRDGYFQSEEEAEVLEEIKKSGAKYILIALGSPRQEFFIDTGRKSIKNALWIGVGGSFDIWSGVIKRAPIIFRKLGLEWLYRLINNPKRIYRIFPTLPIFICRVIIKRIGL